MLRGLPHDRVSADHKSAAEETQCKRQMNLPLAKFASYQFRPTWTMNLLQILNYVIFVTFVQILIQNKLMTLLKANRYLDYIEKQKRLNDVYINSPLFIQFLMRLDLQFHLLML
jgi:hypothetical protein